MRYYGNIDPRTSTEIFYLSKILVAEAIFLFYYIRLFKQDIYDLGRLKRQVRYTVP